jgi:hypothetical protein
MLISYKLQHSHSIKSEFNLIPNLNQDINRLNYILLNLLTSTSTSTRNSNQIIKIYKLLSCLTTESNYYFNSTISTLLFDRCDDDNNKIKWLKSNSIHFNNKFNKRSTSSTINKERINNLNQIVLHNLNNQLDQEEDNELTLNLNSLPFAKSYNLLLLQSINYLFKSQPVILTHHHHNINNNNIINNINNKKRKLSSKSHQSL